MYDKYTKNVTNYTAEVAKWDKAVDAYNAKVKAIQADPKAADPGEPPLNTTKPKPPKEPANFTKDYKDFDISKATPVKGWGKPSKGEM